MRESWGIRPGHRPGHQAITTPAPWVGITCSLIVTPTAPPGRSASRPSPIIIIRPAPSRPHPVSPGHHQVIGQWSSRHFLASPRTLGVGEKGGGGGAEKLWRQRWWEKLQDGEILPSPTPICLHPSTVSCPAACLSHPRHPIHPLPPPHHPTPTPKRRRERMENGV